MFSSYFANGELSNDVTKYYQEDYPQACEQNMYRDDYI